MAAAQTWNEAMSGTLEALPEKKRNSKPDKTARGSYQLGQEVCVRASAWLHGYPLREPNCLKQR